MMKRNWHFAAFLAAVLAVSGCGGGGSSSSSGSGSGGGAPLPVTNPSTSPTGPVDQAAYTCPTSDTATASSRKASVSRGLVRRPPMIHKNFAAASSSLLAVTYDRASLSSARTAFALSEARAGGLFKHEYDFPHIGLTTRIVSVAPARAGSIEAALRAQPGVHSVGVAGARRYPLAVTSPYYTNDPYFTGFPNPIPTPVGNSGNSGTAVPPPTFEQLPYVENGSVPGQWNLHAIRLEQAFGYSVAGNATAYSANALGSASVKIAIIDSGADTTQPDLGPKITYQRCFLTSPGENGTQSTSTYVTDPDGHGTDVSALAGAASNNGFGFTGAGGKVTLSEYRVDPTPDDTCAPGSDTQDDQCFANELDIVAAINDAVRSGANVINLSLGAKGTGNTSGCTNGVDQATLEGNAINDALAANVVVVAASGNDTSLQDAPGCDKGVIAAGATALADGLPNGAGNSNGSPAAPIEYVASYSSYGSPGAAFRNSGAWGIVAPGGDPDTGKSISDYDFLHWVYDLYTSTPFDAADAGSCDVDYPYNVTTPRSCTVLIAGTSMASPTVAGAAALILSVNRSYQNGARMKSLLCSTTDDIDDAREGCGRLNVYRAMAVALHDPTPP